MLLGNLIYISRVSTMTSNSDSNKSAFRSKRISQNLRMGLNNVLKRNSMRSLQHDLKTRDYTDELDDGSNYYYL